MASKPYVVPLAYAEPRHGGKAYRLRELLDAGFYVPGGFVVGPEAFEETVASCGITDLSEIANRPLQLPVNISSAITYAYEAGFRDRIMVVRSSATSEDAPHASAAGQYDTFLGVSGAADICAAVEAGYRSLGSSDTQRYRALRDVDEREERMSVIVQVMESPVIAGVLFTRDPRGDRNMVAEWVHGIGTDVVSGMGAPVHVELPLDESGAMQRNELTGQLFDLGSRLEDAFGAPQDIEWGQLDDGRLAIFQSRNAVISDQICASPRIEDFRNPVVGMSMAPGIAIGNLIGYEEFDTATPKDILKVAGRRSDGIVAHIEGSVGVVAVGGGILSHLGTVVRELRRPAIVVPSSAVIATGRKVIIDGWAGSLANFDEQSEVVKKNAIFEAAIDTVNRGIAYGRHLFMFEAVSIDPRVSSAVLSTVTEQNPIVRAQLQRVIPYDLGEREFTGTSARVKVTGDHVTIQMRRIRDSEGPYRADEDVVIEVPDIASADDLLNGWGLAQQQIQERWLQEYDFSEFAVKFAIWPGARYVHLGIEAKTQDTLNAALEQLGLNPSVFSRLTGLDIFQGLGISLNDCTFTSEENRNLLESGIEKYV